MTNEHSFVAVEYIDPDPTTSSQTQEHALNAAIVQADISKSFEEYLEIFNSFYADDIEVSSESHEEPIRGKAQVSSVLLNFLLPLHAMAEVGGLLISVRQSPIAGDAPDETHSVWTVDLVGVTGIACTLSWCTFRKWNGSRVVYEHHYDQQQNGEPLTFDDLNFDAVKAATRFQRPS